jgi:hypothetical protein
VFCPILPPFRLPVAVCGAARGSVMSTKPPWNPAAMQTSATDRDPNAELHDFEPLRVVLALGALLLGLLLSLP